jgi:hypothetical protein
MHINHYISQEQADPKPKRNPIGEIHHRQIESQPWKMDAWAAKLDIPKQQVRQLAAEVGPVFKDIKDAWEAKVAQRQCADEVIRQQRAPEDLTLDVARREVLAWLRDAAPSAQSLRDEDERICTNGELLKRFMSHAEAAGFHLDLLATGSLSDPGFTGTWQCHGASVGPLFIPESPHKEEAGLFAAAALLRDKRCRRYLNQEDQYFAAA